MARSDRIIGTAELAKALALVDVDLSERYLRDHAEKYLRCGAGFRTDGGSPRRGNIRWYEAVAVKMIADHLRLGTVLQMKGRQIETRRAIVGLVTVVGVPTARGRVIAPTRGVGRSVSVKGPTVRGVVYNPSPTINPKLERELREIVNRIILPVRAFMTPVF